MDVFFNDEMVRALLPHTPIVLYDLYYLPTRGPWAGWLKQGNAEHGIAGAQKWGLDRYDWYLSASVVSESPMPAGSQPYSLVGLDLNDGTLAPGDKPEFVALLDFEHPDFMRERAVQIQACEESGTKYAVLHGRYSIEAIRRIHGTSSIFFLAMRESFGLPICEAQASGSYVFTPYSHWCPSHWIKPDLCKEGPGELSPNFIVYNNDKDRLVQEIARIKSIYDPAVVVETFHRYHRQLYFGDDTELSLFVNKVRNGVITSRSHRSFSAIQGAGHFPVSDQTASLSKRAQT